MRIGLTYTGTDWKHENYVRWLKAGDEAIEVVRLEAGGGGSMIGCDGLVLSGGVDIYPGFYEGGVDYPGSGGWKPERDAFELEMLETALAKAVPVLGVCRGLQLINVYRKGTLVQDLGPVGDAVHQNTPDDKQHTVVVDAGTVLRAVVGEGEGVVNSAHHQSVDRLGNGLRVNCRAADGTIEGLEWAEPGGKSFLLAVQWHPERMYVNGVGDAALYAAIRERFVREVGKGKNL
ncbi:gamma-glutamyl-gamma-aminobutyrate hydrolase family protein [Puia dinghuensis]|uniref:Peptidase C26 n=1 Tax=Puia dinghuensis TaxID=1792502 RepID=A0A8J2UH12_9BACT|nr:gamma-glutamyl-gamma-aminobutyrate hydrolase family protein [Puia dinghuensis]GGB15798.1 peptidase C26 [Puia dinghuensis]